MTVRTPLPRSFFTVNACTLAKNCLGKILVLETGEGRMAGVITETEAYMGVIDRASHAYGGRITARNRTMYKEGGFAYVYRIYGLYHCLNFTAAEEGNPEAVLIRGLFPTEGIGQMAANRVRNGRAKSYPDPADMTRKQLEMLTAGPGRLCTALGIDTAFDGMDLTEGRLYLADGGIRVDSIRALPRVGIDYAGEDRDKPWRFVASQFRE